MPEVGGSYVLTLAVAGGDVGTTAAVVVTDPGGLTSTPSVTGSGTEFEAVVSPVDMVGWWTATWTVTGPGAGKKSSRFYVTATPSGFGVWPPSLADLRLDMSDRDEQVDDQDDRLAMVLDAAIAKVVELKGHAFDLTLEEESGDSDKKVPDALLVLGTLRLAARWHLRRSAWDGMVVVGDGQAIIPAYDADIEKMLRIGRYAPPQDQFA